MIRNSYVQVEVVCDDRMYFYNYYFIPDIWLGVKSIVVLLTVRLVLKCCCVTEESGTERWTDVH